MKRALPSLDGFIDFVRHDMGVSVSVVAGSGDALACAYDVALEWVPQHMGLEDLPALYRACVYNLAGSFLLNYANDTPPETFFADTRKRLGIGGKINGIMTSAGDQGTSGSTVLGDALSYLSLADLMLLQDPYGRAALAILMELGPYWGLTR